MPLIGPSGKDKTIQQKLDQWLPGVGNGNKGLTATGHEGTLHSDGNVLHLDSDCGHGHPATYICQNSSNYTYKRMSFTVCK